MDKWKPMPKSFPDQRPGYSAADLNQFFDTQDSEVIVDSSLKREESFAESTHSDSERPKFSNSRLMRARDSVYYAKDHLRTQLNNESDSDGDVEETEPQVVVSEEETVVKRFSNLSNKSESTRKSQRISVRFSDIPNEVTTERGSTNPAFVDDRGNEPLDYEENNVESAEWQRRSELNQNEEYWNIDGSDEDDDESAIDYSKPAWDSFETIPTEDVDETLSSEWSKLFLKLFKLLAYGITFLLLLCSGVVAKLSIHLIASMTRVNKTVVNCNPNLPEVLDHDKHYHSWLGLNSPERFAWLWVLFFVLITPDLLTLLRSLKICLFKQYEMPDTFTFLVLFSTHSAEVIGVSLFTFVILPHIDVISGLIFTNCIFLLPSYCLWASAQRRKRLKSNSVMAENASQANEEDESNYIFYCYTFALAIQIGALLYPLALYLRDDVNFSSMHGYFTPRDEIAWLWIIPLSGFLISIGYWENFVAGDSEVAFVKKLVKIKTLSVVNKNAVYLGLSIWKMILYFVMLLLIQALSSFSQNRNWHSSWETVKQLVTSCIEVFTSHEIQLIRENSIVDSSLYTSINGWPPVVIGLIQIGSSFLCYNTALFVCKICIQPFSFALPISLILPVSVSVMNFFVNQYSTDVCFFSNIYQPFEYIFWNVHYNVFDLSKGWDWAILFIWFFSFVSQVIVTSHIWISSKERLATIDKLFILPFYNSAILEQSIMLNRRLDEELFNNEIAKEQTSNNEELDDVSLPSNSSIRVGIDSSSAAEKIRIYACATLWHETTEEMLQMLKSICRVDEDQAQRRLAVKWLNVKEHQVDYYEFETHLFVDDAFVFGDTRNENDRHINEYVKLLVGVIDEACSNVHQRSVKIRPPRLFITPYGGRLEWKLPGGSKLISHLKDKLKIRHRKRWSQCMYMYYLLGYKIWEKESDEEKRKKMTDNTFILALDGDINFRPEAVLLLLDLMLKSPDLGAACGRVHPVGTGPMAWYQTFEYAISHWLQKATEHVFGCVLCSPGCFSLFRASALADQNVMNKYTTKPSEALHYVQYDQGEDRWLCTLMLQQGWRVEYSAASDSYTHCPEGFGEFYIQRRRWAPSTMANIIDLLRSYKHTVKKNDNISSLYILYQACLMLGTILSPGTIFLMLVGAVNTAFSLPTQYSFYLNFTPVLAFVLICFFCKQDFQILVAQILSTFYAMLMMAVLISTAITIKKENIFSPSVIFFVGMMVVFVVAALVHPQELTCFFPLPVYMLSIPSNYLLLTIYSIINLNIVTWGTRETPQQQQQPEQAQTVQTPKKDAKLLDDLGSYINSKKKWDFNCMCCTSTKNDEELFYLRDIKESIGKVNTEINNIKGNITTQTKLAKADLNLKRRNSMLLTRNVTFSDNSEMRPLMDFIEDEDEEIDNVLNQFNSTIDPSENTKPNEIEDSKTFTAQSPPWIDDEDLVNAKVVSIKKEEREFWVAFIAKYLAPLIEDKAHQDKVAADLIDLRNKAVFGFGIINIIFVLFVYILQLNNDIFSITFHMNKHSNGTTIDPETGDSVTIYADTPVNMDPIGLVLIIFFGSILLIQCIGMLLHRFGTITHLLAFTDLTFVRVKEEDIHDDRIVDQNSVLIVKYIMKEKKDEDDNDPDFSMEKHFKKFYLRANPRNLVKDMKIPSSRRKSIAVALEGRQSKARRKSFIVDMHSAHLRDFQKRLSSGDLIDESEFESEPEVITNDELEQTYPYTGDSFTSMSDLSGVRGISTNIAENAIHEALRSVNLTNIPQMTSHSENNGSFASVSASGAILSDPISPVESMAPSAQNVTTHL